MSEQNLRNDSDLKPWREVIEPYEEVSSGRFSQSEFALNLAEIVDRNTKGNDGNNEYNDPIAFFNRTYLTVGLKKLLVETLKRLSSGNGDPVVQLKTAFGGGKSHSLLALYHLFGEGISAENSSAVREVLDAAGIESIPKVHTAVIVGTWSNPLHTTLWGEVAKQLAQSAGKPEIYEMMRKNDEKKISPGASLLKDIFNEAGACLILIDELVAYGRKLKSGENSEGGDFDNLISFIQELTEAAKATPKAAVIVSIPESDAEIGNQLGRQVLEQIEKYFGRMESVWTPVETEEGYEIVRRRLFKPCKDERERERVCQAFYDMYVKNAKDFPKDSKEGRYKNKLLACYPIHPKLFDYLYGTWTRLENFQKTRGVLRLMSKVIHKLWASNDKSFMIMPGNIPLYDSNVHNELTKLLRGNWDTIINEEIDGDKSKSANLDEDNNRFKEIGAAKKISRSVFMGTAPSNRGESVNGIDKTEIILSIIQPGEVNQISVLNDAMNQLKENFYYLYSQSTRFWFDVNPTLNKLADDTRANIKADDIRAAIEDRIKTWRKHSKLTVCCCPKDTKDVNDEQTVKLVILPPEYVYDKTQNNKAIEIAKKFLDTCGNIPRRNKNMLIFLVADRENFSVLESNARNFLAWSKINDEVKSLDLSYSQMADAKNQLKLAEGNFRMKLSQTYCCIIFPKKSEDGNLNCPPVVESINCTNEDNILVVYDKLVGDENLIESLGPLTLKTVLDNTVWRKDDTVNLKKLWEYFTTYYYMPRLLDENVLLSTIRRGVKSKVFALAENFQPDGENEFKFDEEVDVTISEEYFIVKAELAQKQLEEKTQPIIDEPEKVIVPEEKILPEVSSDETVTEIKSLSKRFHMDMEIDKTRAIKEFTGYVRNVASLLMSLPSAETSIHVSFDISVKDGIDAEKEETVIANCKMLNIKNFQFE